MTDREAWKGLRCVGCGCPIEGGSGGWYAALPPNLEVCPESLTGFHEADPSVWLDGPAETDVTHYLRAEVAIHCVRDETLDAAVARLRSAVVRAFSPDYHSDIDVEPIESAGLSRRDQESE